MLLCLFLFVCVLFKSGRLNFIKKHKTKKKSTFFKLLKRDMFQIVIFYYIFTYFVFYNEAYNVQKSAGIKVVFKMHS